MLSAYAAAVTVCTYADADVRELAAAAPVPVINALTDGHHPLQAIADLLTLKQRFGPLDERTIAYVGAGNNVTHSLMEAAAPAGMNIAVATPHSYEPGADSTAFAARETARRGRRMLLTHDPVEAANRLPATQAVLCALLTSRLAGR